MQDRIVDPSQKPADGITPFRPNLSANPVTHQHRNDRYGQERGSGHGIGLGEGQRFEKPSFLGLQGKDGNEGHGNHQQGVKKRGAHLGGGLTDDLPVLLFALIAFQVFVGVFDHDDGSIHHGSDGNGNAAQGHNVGVNPLVVHHRKGHQDRQRQGSDSHHCRAKM